MKNILVTGGTGFAGTHLIAYLQSVLDLSEYQLHVTHFGNSLSEQFSNFDPRCLHQLDLQDPALVRELIKRVQPVQIYHLAAFASAGDSFAQAAHVINNNSSIQLYILDAVAEIVPSARVLVVGSAEEYGISEAGELPISEDHPFRPVNPYAVSKVTQDMLGLSYVYSHHLDVVRVRPFNHTGEGQTPAFAIPAFASQIVAIEAGRQQELSVGNLDAKRDISDVLDVVRAYYLVMTEGKTGEVYNIGSGQSWSMREIVDALISFAKVPISVVTDENRLRPSEIPEMTANISRIRSLGWEPQISRDQTLQRVLNWWRSRENQNK